MASTSLSQFHLFPSLPYELRLKIYGMVLDEPRTLTINSHKGILLPSTRRYIKSFITSTPIPPLLHVSHESRVEALVHYKPLFCTSHSPSYIYVNFSNDTIKLADGILSYLVGEEREGIQKMQLEVQDSAYFGHYNMEFMTRMEGLKELEILAESNDVNSWQPEEYYLKNLVRDLREARRDNPEWCCPGVRIINGRSGEEFAIVEGGVWMEEEEEAA